MTRSTENSINPTIGTRSKANHQDNSITKQSSKNRLPLFLLSNIQSFGNSEKTDKTTEVEAILDQNKIDIACLTETWLNDITKDQILLNNYVNFHSVRNKVLRASGGISILVENNIPANVIDNINVPEHIEALWVSVRPKWLPRSISNIVVVGVYYPGSNSEYAPNQDDIILHITESVHKLLDKYAKPLFVIMGDFNDLKVNEICDSCALKQVVKVPTRKEAILDLILTNKNNKLYKKPITLPSIGSSDHLCVLYEPIDEGVVNIEKSKTLIRKFHKSAINEFGSWLTKFDWSILLNIQDVNLKISYFSEIMWTMIDKLFPLIKVVTARNDKEWITPKIKSLIAQRQKAHLSKSYDVRDELAKRVKVEIKKAKHRYNALKAKTFSNNKAKEWYQHINNLINNGKRKNIVLNNVPELVQKPMEEIVEIVNNHFATICQTYPSLSNDFQSTNNPNEDELKPISEFDTYRLLKKFSKKSLGPNDFPRQIMEEFAMYLALPFSDITNCALRSGIFPDAYKISEIVPIPKENPPRALKDLRPISKTPIGGKIIEKRMMNELETDIKETLNDPSQYGNTKGSSTTHYLIKLTDEACKSTDSGKATTAITIDYSKAFDLVDHSTLIKKLSELGIRNNLLKLIISFLKNRKHYTKINGVKSELTDVTCGVPQGTISGPKLFTILIKGVKCPMVLNVKFVDDKTLIHSYSGDPTSFLQNVLNIENTETIKDKMKINESKCNIINFNFSNKNFPPKKLNLNNNEIISVDRIKLLGVIITSDLRWRENTAQIVTKVNKKFYMLCRLKQFGVKQQELVTTWKGLIRPITEYAAPLWHSGLLECDKRTLENLQKKALGLILGTIYIDHRRYYKVNGLPVSYEVALSSCDLISLAERRQILTSKFAHDTFENPIHKDFFEKISESRPNTRSNPIVKEKTWLTSRCTKSAIPTMSRMINSSRSTRS